MKFFKFLFILVIIIFVSYGVFVLVTKPSNDRQWSKDMNVLSSAIIQGDVVTLNNIRNNLYRSTSDFDVNYYNALFNVKNLDRVYLITDPFGNFASHTMLDFEFKDGQKVVLSVEIRREVGEVFQNFKGLFRGYELYYVWSSELDVIKLRTNYRMDDVYMYPLKMSKENSEKLFIEALKRTNELKDNPEFYNLLFNNCTTNLAEMLQRVYNKKIIVDWRYLAPAYAEGLSMKYDLIDGDPSGGQESILNIRKSHNISSSARRCGDCLDYSRAIRSY